MRPSTLEKQNKILEIATELFLAQGYKETSLDQIVAQTGGSKQTLYRYFTNKEGLFEAVLVANTKKVDPIFALSETEGRSLQATLVQFGHDYLQLVCSNPILGLFRIVSNDFHAHPTIPQAFWEHGPCRAHANLVRFLDSEWAQQSLAIPDAQRACEQLLALFKQDHLSLALLGQPLPEKVALDGQITAAVEAFFMLYQREGM
ncbi:transcriptional regulator TetR family [Photobacterium aphoticum]|uniref:Transcriptional regulator TetR family n=1 Tax=Photobacterium aphoticum TaxID=754436 RepID=A0A090QRA1_9GAMM|nr:transcriptional regulator TetR family [Photobacterium aphoticum]